MASIVQRFTGQSVLLLGRLISHSPMTANFRSGDADDNDVGVAFLIDVVENCLFQIETFIAKSCCFPSIGRYIFMACALKIMPGKDSLPRSTYVGSLILIAKSPLRGRCRQEPTFLTRRLIIFALPKPCSWHSAPPGCFQNALNLLHPCAHSRDPLHCTMRTLSS